MVYFQNRIALQNFLCVCLTKCQLRLFVCKLLIIKDMKQRVMTSPQAVRLTDWSWNVLQSNVIQILYFLDYATQTEIFQIGERKTMHHNVLMLHN